MTIPHVAQRVACRSRQAALAYLTTVLTLALPAATQAETSKCVTKHGSATGVTRSFAEYEAFLIIRQVTGNWPFQQDRISEPKYKCKGEGMMWTCSASATVCKS